MSTVLIANPAAGGGRGARTLARLTPLLSSRGIRDVRITARTGDESVLTHAALDAGATTIIALGGDGTWSRVAAAIAQAESSTPLALLAAGSGNDFVRTLGLPAHDAAATLSLIDAGRARPIDLGRVDDVMFLNVAGFGFDAHVVRADRGSRLLPPRMRYLWTALREIARYPGIAASIDGGPRQSFVTLAIANGRYFGGAFAIAPGAVIDDGQLDLVRIANAGLVARTQLLIRAMRRAHVGDPLTQTDRAPSFRAVFDEAPWFQADGELYRAAAPEVALSVVRSALRLVAP